MTMGKMGSGTSHVEKPTSKPLRNEPQRVRIYATTLFVDVFRRWSKSTFVLLAPRWFHGDIRRLIIYNVEHVSQSQAEFFGYEGPVTETSTQRFNIEFH